MRRSSKRFRDDLRRTVGEAQAHGNGGGGVYSTIWTFAFTAAASTLARML